MVEENLPIVVEEWTPDGLKPVEVLARVANVPMARAMFPAARGLRPRARILIRDRALVISDSAELDRTLSTEK